MAQDRTFKVRWIVSPSDRDRAGTIGTTTHPGRTPAGAALASAEAIIRALSDGELDGQFHVLSVSTEESGPNLLSGDDLRAALRCHDKMFPIEIVYRPLC